MEQTTIDRVKLAESIQWLTPDSGTGFGICSFAGMIMHQSGPKISMMLVRGPMDKYTDAELALLADFAQHVDVTHPKDSGWNNMVFDKETLWNPRWLRKRMSWEMGPMYSLSLPEALGIFYIDVYTKNVLELKPWVFLTDDGYVGQIISETPDGVQYKEPDYLTYVLKALDGTTRMISRRQNAIFAADRKSLKQQVLMALENRAAFRDTGRYSKFGELVLGAYQGKTNLKLVLKAVRNGISKRIST